MSDNRDAINFRTILIQSEFRAKVKFLIITFPRVNIKMKKKIM